MMGAGADVLITPGVDPDVRQFRVFHADRARADAALSDAIGRGLPRPGEVFEVSTARLVGIAPYEWLVLDGSEVASRHARHLCDAGVLTSISNMSDAYSRLMVSGPAAIDVLSSDCGVDLRRVDRLRVLTTRIAKVRAMVMAPLGPDSFEVLCETSAAVHLRRWLHTVA